jgi:hypothetical protein
MAGRTIYTQRLSGWDVIAALVGLAITVVIESLPVHGGGFRVFWFGAPATVIVARRWLLPGLSARSTETPVPSTPLRRVVGYVLLIGGGFAMFIDAIVIWAAMHERAPLPIAVALAIFACAAWVAALGFRRVS